MRIHRQGAFLNVLTPAKLNLSLRIVGRRDDGFHDLESLMISIRLFDFLQFAPHSTSEIAFSLANANGPAQSTLSRSVPSDDQNLVFRAAKQLQETVQTRQGVRILLSKQIPVEAGLGGGSSDAAATLVALNRFWRLNLPNSELHRIAAKLGSDINFFLDSNSAAICTGRGEHVRKMPIHRRLNFVVVKPASGLSTAEVFRIWSRDAGSESTANRPLHSAEDVLTAINSGSLRNIQATIHNSLQAPAEKLNPDVSGVLSHLEKENVVVRAMTGSGSACFGICRTKREAQQIAARLRSQKIGSVWTATSGV